MFGKLFLVFAILPILEIMVLINVSDQIGGWNTFSLVVITAFFGAYFVRREGLQTLANMRSKSERGEMPGAELSEGVLLLIAGVLLVTPGFITDGFGLLLTLPLTRKPIAAKLVKLIAAGAVSGAQFSFYQQNTHQGQAHSPFSGHAEHARRGQQDGDIIDGQYEDMTDTTKPANINQQIPVQKHDKPSDGDSKQN